MRGTVVWRWVIFHTWSWTFYSLYKMQPHTALQVWAPQGEPKGHWPDTTQQMKTLKDREDGNTMEHLNLWSSSHVNAASRTRADRGGPTVMQWTSDPSKTGGQDTQRPCEHWGPQQQQSLRNGSAGGAQSGRWWRFRQPWVGQTWLCDLGLSQLQLFPVPYASTSTPHPQAPWED